MDLANSIAGKVIVIRKGKWGRISPGSTEFRKDSKAIELIFLHNCLSYIAVCEVKDRMLLT